MPPKKTSTGDKIPALTFSKLIGNARRKDLLRYMFCAREFDLAMQRLNRQGRAFGGVYSQMGNEATAVGSAAAMGTNDVLFPMHRDIGGHFVFGQDAKTLMINQLARDGSMMRGTDGTGHYADTEKRIYGNVSHLGSMIPVAGGFALAAKMRGENIVAMTYIGDGGSQTGEFHEGINFAAVQKLPLVLIIENNQYAYSSPNSVEFACEKLSDRALGYGCRGETIDGTDIELVYERCAVAIEHARNGGGPSIIETRTMRMRGHAEHDDFSYVPKEMLEYWQRRDPVERYEQALISKKIMTTDEVVEMRESVVAEIRAAIDYAVELPFPPAEEGFKNVFV
ncbi:thiamine pyrophosphate-dependent dehydrogenase E1 component subunit alpha [Ignavibacteria bacterium]|nr:thiamine pyrophosphate-dependent dehydrogenase E1 component subunit alpha [Bacteroidota bacterium]MCZ2131707.1 thiamine pyrophosphate-dependent dehydrogenase E1 component subunit alpha [Bacteroidota bacterium]